MLVFKYTITLYIFRDKKHVNLKKEKKTILKDNRIITLLYFTYNRVSVIFYFVEMVSPIRILIAVHLMVSLVVNTLKYIKTRFVFLHNKSW